MPTLLVDTRSETYRSQVHRKRIGGVAIEHWAGDHRAERTSAGDL